MAIAGEGLTLEREESPTRLRSAQEIADHLGLTRQSVYNLMKAGMPSLKVGRARRFRLDQVDAWLDAQQGVGGDAA